MENEKQHPEPISESILNIWSEGPILYNKGARYIIDISYLLLYDLRTNIESQPDTIIILVVAVVGEKDVSQFSFILQTDAHPVVFYGNTNLVHFSLLNPKEDESLIFVSELDGVGDQVDYHLVEPILVIEDYQVITCQVVL